MKNFFNALLLFLFPWCVYGMEQKPFKDVIPNYIGKEIRFAHLRKLFKKKGIVEKKTINFDKRLVNSFAIDSKNKYLAIGTILNGFKLISFAAKKGREIIYEKSVNGYKRVCVGFINDKAIYNFGPTNVIKSFDPKRKKNTVLEKYQNFVSLVTNQSNDYAIIDDKTLIINGKIKHMVDLPPQLIFSKNIIAGSKDKKVIFYDLNTNKLDRLELDPKASGNNIALNSGATLLGVDQFVWDLKTKQKIKLEQKTGDIPITIGEVKSNAFGLKNKTFAVALDKKIIFWNIETKKHIATLKIKLEDKSENVIKKILFSPDGNLFVIEFDSGKMLVQDLSNFYKGINYINRLMSMRDEFIQHYIIENIAKQKKVTLKYAQFLFFVLLDESISKSEKLDFVNEDWLKTAYNFLPLFVKKTINDQVELGLKQKIYNRLAI